MPFAALPRMIAIALLLTATACQPVSTAETRPLVVRNGTLIDGGANRAVEDAVLVIERGMVSAVGPADEIAIPPDAEVVDAAEGWIVPGFIDAHVHLRRVTSLEAWERSGVTTLVDNGSTERPGALRERLPGALACGPIVTARGGYPSFGDPDAPAFVWSDGAALREMLDDMRPDCVKIAVERGFLADAGDEGWPMLERDEVGEIVAAANERRLPLLVHVTQPGELALTIEAGGRVFAHTPIDPIPDDLLGRAAEAGVIFVSTAALWEAAGHSPIVASNLSRYLALGGRFAFGSDYPNLRSDGLAMRELRLLARHGIAPSALLDALTRNAAAAIGRTDLGRLSPGSRADLVILSSDPRSSVEALTDVVRVIRNGEIVFPRIPLSRDRR